MISKTKKPKKSPKPPRSIATEAQPGALPTIVVNNRQLPEISHEVFGALAAANHPPRVFTQSGMPARIRVSDDGSLMIALMNATDLRSRCARVASFIKVDKNGLPISVSPPMDAVRDVLSLDLHAHANAAGLNPIPPLDAISTMPVLRPDYSIIEISGYDAATRLFYAPSPGLTIPLIDDRPTPEHVGQAVSLLDEAFGEFPYVTPADRANALATAITPVIRQIVGKSPLALFDAPQVGTGKSLLAESIGLIFIGYLPALMGAPTHEAEWRKQITAILLGGAVIVVIDNVVSILDSPSLSRVLTAGIWSDRFLGRSRQLNLVQRATWIATGNNIRVGGDMPRRCYRVRLDAKMARPWLGREFRHPDLLQWIAENRGRLIWAMLTLCRAWYVAGCPLPTDIPIIGSFESWSRTVGGVLHFAGVEGFLGNIEDLYEQSDEGANQWESFLRAWHHHYGSAGVAVGKIAEDLQSEAGAALRDTLPNDLAGYIVSQPPSNVEAGKFTIQDVGSFKIRLGKSLQQRLGRRYGNDGLHLNRSVDSHSKTAIWAVESAGGAGDAGSNLTQGEIWLFRNALR